LTRYCRHELMHISDMLYPVFGYDPDTKVGLNPGEETLILHRYRILWSLSIDSRLVSAGKEPMLRKEDRFKEFRSWYRKIPALQLKSVFEGLWQTSFFTHSELIEMATDTLRVMDRAVDVEGGEVPETENKVMLMPGFPCPLCRFPTYSWVEDMENKIETYVLDFIRENHPGWDVEFGACDRCVEVYKLRADGVMCSRCQKVATSCSLHSRLRRRTTTLTVATDPKYGRRDFFKDSVLSVAKAAKEYAAHVDAAPEKPAALARTDWLRPPGATGETLFLERCTKCNDCVKACPHDSI